MHFDSPVSPYFAPDPGNAEPFRADKYHELTRLSLRAVSAPTFVALDLLHHELAQ